MTAEQLRRRFERIADKLDNLPTSNDKVERALDDLATDIRLLAARLSGMAAGWQPIGTAPRDRSVLVHSPSHGILEAKWSDWLEMFLADRICGLGLPEADGWREIPAAPEPPHV